MKQRGAVPMILVGVLLAACAAPPMAQTRLQPFTTDGCSMFPDRALIGRADWCHCCLAHDLAYWRGGTEPERDQADRSFRACVRQASGSAALAELMFAGVVVGGGPYFQTPYRWGYGWPGVRAYGPLSEAERMQADGLEQQVRQRNPGLQCALEPEAAGSSLAPLFSRGASSSR